ncbi:MAG: Phage Coat protein [Proteobacteria bacterium]|nr:Phage Coat protein [Pseudomonadota bacterium]
MFKSSFSGMKSMCRNGAVKVAAGISSLVAAGASYAAVDLTAVQTGITGAQTSGETVGGYVIAAVAGLVVVGVILAIVRKI